jgi:HAE1 family hydrophobic/amphiphilic exporter-1
LKLLEIPIYRPVTTGMFLVCLTVLGIVGIYLLPLDFFPMVKEPEIDVNVPFPGSHPLEALEEVARPLEEEIATISGLKRMETDIRNSNVEVEAMFSWSSDVDLKRMEVREAVERARSRLPDRIGHILVEGDTDGPSGGSILQGRISAERDLSESWALLDQHIRRPLERVPGVARVDLYGVEPQQVRVDLDLARLQEHGIDAGELARRIDSENQDVDVGVIRGDSIRYELRTVGRFRSVDEMRELSIGAGDLRLGDVADVSMEEPRLDYGRHLNRKFAIGIDVYKEPSANTVETVDRVLVEIEHIQTDPRLEGVILLVWENAAKEIRGSLSSLRNAGMFGGCLAIVVLFFFLKRIGSTLIVGTAIPFSLVVTCGVMYLFDMPFDVLSMLGLMLGVGMLVDNAVVVMENIHRHRAMGKSPQEAALTGVREVGLAVLASTATTVIVWSWLFTAERSPMTIYIGVVAAVICFSVGCSLLISLTFIPMMTARFGVGQAPAPGFILRRVIPGYRQLLGWTLRHRFVTLVLLVILASSAAFPLAMLEKTGEPKNIQTSVPIIYEVFDASTKKTLERHVNQVEAWVWERRDELQIENMYTFYSEPKRVITSLYLAEGRSGEKELEVLREKLEENLPVLAGVRLRVGDGNFGSGMNLGRRLVFLALQG